MEKAVPYLDIYTKIDDTKALNQVWSDSQIDTKL